MRRILDHCDQAPTPTKAITELAKEMHVAAGNNATIDLAPQVRTVNCPNNHWLPVLVNSLKHNAV
jgi:hypothetical protein